jgi:hypothetical protein
VALNTPGKQDGSFYLEVNGIPVIDRNDVYYRGNGSLQDSPANVESASKEPKLAEDLPSLHYDTFETSDVLQSVQQYNMATSSSSSDPIFVDSANSKQNANTPIGFTGLFFRLVFSNYHFHCL